MKEEDPLVALGERIERLTLAPDEVRAPLVRLARPLLRAIGYRPPLRTAHIEALLAALREKGQETKLEALLAEAVEELEGDVIALERTLVVHGRAPLGHVAWLGRLHGVVAKAARAVRDSKDEGSRRVAAAIDPVRVAPPLAVTPAQDKAEAAGNEAPATPESSAPPAEERLIETELLAVDRLLEAAWAETEFLSRRRRLLEASRKLLLDAAAALPLAREGVEVRQQHLAREIGRIDRLEAAGLSPSVALWHQAREAMTRGDRQRLHAALVAMDGISLSALDGDRSALLSRALDRMDGASNALPTDEAARRSLRRSGEEMFGREVLATIAASQAAARERLSHAEEGETPADREFRLLALQWLSADREDETLSALLAVDGCFDVGVPLSPVRVTEVETQVRAVSHPTQEMILLPARDVTDVPQAIIEDPRLVLLQLVEGRLLARRFVERTAIKRQRTQLVGEARFYVLDGSTSMLEEGKAGARARVRDAILLAELSMLIRRYAEGRRDVRVVMHYRFFTKRMGPLARVSNGKEALAAMADVIGTPRKGGTDIERALLSSFEEVRRARQEDPDLARAQIVLVTDGNAVVREEVVREAREKVGDLPIGVSVIALGEENPTLRALVSRQRARGERAFYHFLDDDALADICEGKLVSGRPLHAAYDAAEEGKTLEERAASLREEMGELMEELSTLSDARSAAALEAALADAESLAEKARAEAALGIGTGATKEGQRAQREALDRDRRALEARFLRWFPQPVEKTARTNEAASEDAEAAMLLLSTVAEVASELGGSELARQADAIELLERLLPDARLTPARWQAVLAEEAARLSPGLAVVHAAVGRTKPAG